MTFQYIHKLVANYPDVIGVWLIGSRAEGSERPNSDWDYLVFANHGVLRSLIQRKNFKTSEIDLLVVYDGDRFMKPWRDGSLIKRGSLSGWQWERISETEATYKATKFSEDGDFYHIGRGKRIWPPSEVGRDG